MTDELIVPLYPDHPRAQKQPEAAPLYNSKAAFQNARTKLLQTLETRYPDHFGKQGQPWAIGLREDLLAAMADSGFAEPLLRHTLHHFSRSVRYLTNCVLSGYGAPRLRLDGTPEGTVNRRELIFALTQLSGMVQRKDEDQCQQYRLWAMREMVLGFLHGDLDAEALEKAKVRKSLIKRAQKLAEDEAAVAELQLRNRRSGEPHPSVYAMPYLPLTLQKAFLKRHPDHITTGKLKKAELKAAKRPAKAKPKLGKPAPATVRKPAPARPVAQRKPASFCADRPGGYQPERSVPAKAAPKVTVRRRRLVTGGGV